MEVKRKITIIGPKVSSLDHREHLLFGAMGWGVSRFEAFSLDEGQITVLVSAEEKRIKNFEKFIRSNRPAPAEVSEITIIEYDGNVSPIFESAMAIAGLRVCNNIEALQDQETKTAAMNANKTQDNG
jgi:hypothetical protein